MSCHCIGCAGDPSGRSCREGSNLSYPAISVHCIICNGELLLDPPHCEDCHLDGDHDYTEEEIAACYSDSDAVATAQLWEEFQARAAKVDDRQALYDLPYPVSWLMSQLADLFEKP